MAFWSGIGWSFGRLRVRFTLYVAILLVAFTAVVQSINWRSQEQIVRDRLTAHVAYVADLAAELVEDRFASGAGTDLAPVLMPIVELEDSIAIAVVSPAGRILASGYGDATPPGLRAANDRAIDGTPWPHALDGPGHIERRASVGDDGSVATVHVARALFRPGQEAGSLLDNAEFGAEASSLQQTLTRNALLGLAIFVLALPLAWLLMSRATRGISSVIGAAHRASEGNLDVAFRRPGGGEVGELQSAFRRMAATLKRNIREIEDLAYKDQVTGLPNRARFAAHVNDASARGGGAGGAILLIGLDDMKAINDTHGHRFGDAVLAEVAAHLERTFATFCRRERLGDAMLARFGDDAFTAFVGTAPDDPAIARLAKILAAALDDLGEVDGRRVHLEASVGIATFSGPRIDVEKRLQEADLAMNEARKSGRGRARFFSGAMMAAAERRVAIANDLRKAVGNGELAVFYQPKVDCETLKIVGAEALVRWNHPEHGPVPPAEFIPVAEETGLIAGITGFVLDRALNDFAGLHRAGAGLSLAVNVSAQDLAAPDFVTAVTDALARTGFPPHLLEIELTESEAIASTERARAPIRRLKEHGIRLAIDDFGTGYSSLSRLPAFNFDTLKIDRSFVTGLAADSDNQTIVDLILSLAQSLDMDVVAEGVEHEDDFRVLQEAGADTAQGYLWSPPVPFREFAWLAAANAGTSAGFRRAAS